MDRAPVACRCTWRTATRLAGPACAGTRAAAKGQQAGTEDVR